MLTSVKRKIRNTLISTASYDLVPFQPATHPDARIAAIVNSENIDTCIDIGASAGGYAKRLRRIGYDGRIISFEPLKDSFYELSKVAKKDDRWVVFNTALGNTEGVASINVSENKASSSFLDMLPAHFKAAPDSKYLGQETVSITTLDSVFRDIVGTDDRVFLKIDSQGFEYNILQGASRVIREIRLIQMELSLTPLYAGETLFYDMLKIMNELSFLLISIEPGFTDVKSGHVLQVDCVFRNNTIDF
ncbi:MAG: FkbM family methyltransferase [Azospirillaceae bacterium]